MALTKLQIENLPYKIGVSELKKLHFMSLDLTLNKKQLVVLFATNKLSPTTVLKVN